MTKIEKKKNSFTFVGSLIKIKIKKDILFEETGNISNGFLGDLNALFKTKILLCILQLLKILNFVGDLIFMVFKVIKPKMLFSFSRDKKTDKKTWANASKGYRLI